MSKMNRNNTGDLSGSPSSSADPKVGRGLLRWAQQGVDSTANRSGASFHRPKSKNISVGVGDAISVDSSEDDVLPTPAPQPISSPSARASAKKRARSRSRSPRHSLSASPKAKGKAKAKAEVHNTRQRFHQTSKIGDGLQWRTKHPEADVTKSITKASLKFTGVASGQDVYNDASSEASAGEEAELRLPGSFAITGSVIQSVAPGDALPVGERNNISIPGPPSPLRKDQSPPAEFVHKPRFERQVTLNPDAMLDDDVPDPPSSFSEDIPPTEIGDAVVRDASIGANVRKPTAQPAKPTLVEEDEYIEAAGDYLEDESMESEVGENNVN